MVGKKTNGGRHPGGRTCNGLLPMAILMTFVAMWKHRRELKELV